MTAAVHLIAKPRFRIRIGIFSFSTKPAPKKNQHVSAPMGHTPPLEPWHLDLNSFPHTQGPLTQARPLHTRTTLVRDYHSIDRADVPGTVRAWRLGRAHISLCRGTVADRGCRGLLDICVDLNGACIRTLAQNLSDTAAHAATHGSSHAANVSPRTVGVNAACPFAIERQRHDSCEGRTHHGYECARRAAARKLAMQTV